MATVLIPIVFQGPTRGESRADVDGETIVGCLDLVEALYPGLKPWWWTPRPEQSTNS